MAAEWEQIKDLFHQALDLDPAERSRFLDHRCKGDDDLRREVESLLESSDTGPSFLETPALAGMVDPREPNCPKLEEGSFLGQYEIGLRIGAGGMGEVYLARDLKLDRQVAIKILHPDLRHQESNLHRFVQEARAASALNHPNILVIHEIGETSDSHFIVSEFVDGKTLREVLGERTLSIREILEISIQVANALAAAHRVHLIHRDIKPENIMVRPDGYVKILDFGLAKLIEPEYVPAYAPAEKANGATSLAILPEDTAPPRKGQTAHGVILGTVNYMSPEQARGEPADERSDIFSLGAVMFEMLTGKPPFVAESVAGTLSNLTSATAVPPALMNARAPAELERVVTKALRSARSDRYSSIEALLADLRALSITPTANRGTASEEAYGLYVQGSCRLATHFPEDVRASVGYFEKAIELDPAFATPHIALAQAYVLMSHSGGGSQAEFMERARAEVAKALELDPDQGEAYAVLGEIEYLYEWNFEKAEENFARAIRLDPGSELAHSIYGEYLASVGRFDEAVSEAKTGYELNPLSCANQVIYGRILYLARRFDDADLQFKRVVEIFPQWSTAYGWIWLVYEIRGDHENAFKWLVANQERNNAPAERIRMFKDAWEKAGWLGVGEKLLEVERPQNNTGNYYAAARHATRLGDLDLAIEYLNRSFDLRQYQMTWLKVDPYFDPLRGDPRYDLLVERVGLS